MKTSELAKSLLLSMAILALVFALTSCAIPDGWRLDLRTPYGDATSAKDGTVIIAPKPIVISQSGAK